MQSVRISKKFVSGNLHYNLFGMFVFDSDLSTIKQILHIIKIIHMSKFSYSYLIIQISVMLYKTMVSIFIIML
jgi:hypothetical protein